MNKPASESVPRRMRPTYESVVALTDPFCQEHLSQEYGAVCRRLAAALCRKRPSPLLSGNLNSWACAIVYTVASLNFLFDKSNPSYMGAAELSAAFGIPRSTAGNKSKAIRDALRIKHLDWHWCLPSKLEEYPLAWTIEVNGLIVDARRMPREIQEEAFRKGFIPYLPPTGRS